MKFVNDQIIRSMSWFVTKARVLTKSRVSFATIILALFCAALAATKLLLEDKRENKGVRLLKDSFRTCRLIESRIVGFDYAPLVTTRGAGQEAALSDESFRRAERIVLDAVYSEPDAKSHRALAVFNLLNKQFDGAIEEFEKALSYEPSSAELHSDLGSALFEKAKAEFTTEKAQSEFTGKPVEYLSRSIEQIQKALYYDGSLKESIFNLGLVQELLGLHFVASATLSQYVELEPSSGWAQEARERISLVEEKKNGVSSSSKQELLRDFLDAFEKRNVERAWRITCENRSPLNGKYVSELLIDAYIAQSIGRELEESTQTLSALSFLGELEIGRANEHYTSELVRYLKARTLPELEQLRQARDLVQRGHELYILDRGDEAIRAYSEAKREFDRLGDNCESLSAEYRIAYCESEDRDTTDSRPRFDRLSITSETHGFKLLRLRSLLGIASDEFSQKAYSKAIRYGWQAVEIARQVGDEVSALTSLDSTMEYYRAVENDRRVLSCVQQSLEYSSCPSTNGLQNFGHYSRIASALLDAGYIDASLDLRKEAFNFLMRDVPRDAALYFADLGSTYVKLKKYEKALESLNLADEEAKAISPETPKNIILAYVLLQKGSLYKDRGDFQNALAAYSESLTLSERADFPMYVYQARKGRLYCYIALSEDSKAENEIVKTTNLLEDDRSRILEHEDRNYFFDAEQDVYDLAINYEHRRGDRIRAFDYSEESRSRSLLDLLQRESEEASHEILGDISIREVFRPLTMQTIQAQLPKELQILQYSVLADKTIIWLLASDAIFWISVDISQQDLNKRVRAYLNYISHYTQDNSRDISALSRDLYSILIAPVSTLLRREGSVCIVPDKLLNILPFETLVSSQSQKYLVEDFNVLYSPSSSVLLACIEKDKSKESHTSEKMLGIGNPYFDHALFKGLSDLSAAQREVEKIASYYRESTVLTGDAAREEDVRKEMRNATVIHFATHSLLDEDSPLRSKILLTKETTRTRQDSDGVLESREICRTKLANARLVVLASCQSGIDRYYRGEGTMSLARSFLAAGVPTVVASLWEVDSNATEQLMVEFHRFKQQEKLAVAESLRQAKLNMLRGPDNRFRHPYFWSAFIAVGGQATF